MLEGKSLLYGFNELLGAFLAKGEEEGDEVQVLRHASQTRPLGLKNADIKILTNVCCRALTRRLPQLVHHTQRGLIPTRNFGDNVL
eukprot:7130706-Pyramimonas_sp.AAC.1